MNRNLKFAIAAAIASLGVTGQAHALTNPGAPPVGSLFLYAFEDRGLNTDRHQHRHLRSGLGLRLRAPAASQPSTSAPAAAWTSYIATIANPANINWGVFGALARQRWLQHLLTTLSVVALQHQWQRA